VSNFGRIPGKRPTSFEELSQKLLEWDEECGEDMWRLCKELNGTKSQNERDYFLYGEITKALGRLVPTV
jgi:hypothetical protein